MVYSVTKIIPSQKTLLKFQHPTPLFGFINLKFNQKIRTYLAV